MTGTFVCTDCENNIILAQDAAALSANAGATQSVPSRQTPLAPPLPLCAASMSRVEVLGATGDDSAADAAA